MSSVSTVSVSLEVEEEVAIMEEIVVGYGFHPTDEELVDYYLKNKRLGRDDLVSLIPEVDVCKLEPWDLPDKSVIKSNDRVWYFFCPLDLKYPKSNRHNRLNRATEAGYWKATGKDRKVKIRGTNSVIATKKTLVFYIGRSPKGVRTDWVMHEYHATETLPDQRAFVLILLKNKADEKTNATTCDESEPSSFNATTCVESETSSFNATTCVESETSSFNVTTCVESELSELSSCNTFDLENLVGENDIPIQMEYIQSEAEPESHFQVCHDFSSAQQLPMHNQHEPSVNGHSNDHNGVQSQIDSAQLEEDLTRYSLIDDLFWGDINPSIALGENISPMAGEP